MAENDHQEDRSLEIYRERVTKVESQVEIISFRQTQMQLILDRQTALLERIATQITTSEMGIIAIRERTDEHSKEIESLQKDGTDVSKILSAMKVQIDIMKYVGATIATFIIAYLLSHFFH